MKINWSEPSRDDVRELVSYVTAEFGRRKGTEVYRDIRTSAEQLRDFPMSGKRFVEDTEIGIVYRSLTCRLYRIIYYIEEESINIVTVWQNRQDLNRLMKDLEK